MSDLPGAFSETLSVKRFEDLVSTPLDNGSMPLAGSVCQCGYPEAREKVIVRTIVTFDKEAAYMMVEVPIPAGCVPATGSSRWGDRESGWENYKGRTVIYCSYLPKGSYTFDVAPEVRYKGWYNISPACAQMMYFANEYGHTDAKKIAVH